MDVKVFIPLEVDGLIRNTGFPVNGGERLQVILILSLLEIGCNVWVSWDEKIPHEEIDKKFFKKKGNINFITEKQLGKLDNNFFDLTFTNEYVHENKYHKNWEDKSEGLVGCAWSSPEETWDFGEKLKTVLYYDHFSIFDNESYFLKDRKTSKFKTTSKHELNHRLWIPPLKEFIGGYKWNPKHRRIIIDDLYRNDDWVGREYLVECIHKATYDIIQSGDVFVDFIARNSFLTALEVNRGSAPKNTNFNFIGGSDDYNMANNTRILLWHNRDLLLRYISESCLYISTFPPTDRTQYRKGIMEPVVMGVPSFLYINDMMPNNFEQRWGEIVPGTNEYKHFVEHGSRDDYTDELFNTNAPSVLRWKEKLVSLFEKIIDNPEKTSESLGFKNMSLVFQDFFNTESSHNSLREIVEVSL
jgi:hypothetical protein